MPVKKPVKKTAAKTKPKAASKASGKSAAKPVSAKLVKAKSSLPAKTISAGKTKKN
jgi:hypothetical protein